MATSHLQAWTTAETSSLIRDSDMQVVNFWPLFPIHLYDTSVKHNYTHVCIYVITVGIFKS